MVVWYNVHWILQGVGYGEIVLIGCSRLALVMANLESNDAIEYCSQTIQWLPWR